MAAAMTTRADVATRLRLASGLVLMAFACSHLLNHTLGIHSLAAMEAGGRVFVAVGVPFRRRCCCTPRSRPMSCCRCTSSGAGAA
jgi:hypothetical protein